jgi:hypothetical protein
VLFNCSKHIASQEKAPPASNRVPAQRVQVLYPIRKDKTESSRTVPIAMPFTQILEAGFQPNQRMMAL